MEQRERVERRIMRFVSGGRSRVSAAASGDKVLLEGGDRGTICAPVDIFEGMVKRGRLGREGDEVWLLGASKELPAGSPSGGQGRDLDVVAIEQNGERINAIVNLSESPLGKLARHRGKDGTSFLSAVEYRAGERLRADYTRGQIMPRMGANWEASVASGRRGGGNGIAELTEAALAARLRVEKAISAVGPELSGVLIDVCCFLKGLETVESERGWPARSAKIVLKTALGALGRHYEPPTGQGRRSARVLHWGDADYRPKID